MRLGELLAWADSAFQRSSAYINAFVLALIVLLSGFIVSRLADRLLYKLFLRLDFDDKCYAVFGKRRNYARATRTAVVYGIYVLTIYFALRQLYVDEIALFLLGGFVVLLAVASLFLAGIEVVPNLLARRMLSRRHVKKGDTLEIRDTSGDIEGKVIGITLMDVQVKRPNGDVIFFPNRALFRLPFTRRKAK